ncbi:MAG: hypothetical protein ACYC0V_07545 [Armatimonadota bacterium]
MDLMQTSDSSPTQFLIDEFDIGGSLDTIPLDDSIDKQTRNIDKDLLSMARNPENELESVPVRLNIEDHEIRCMQELSWLLSRSPRSIKRFVNIYKIIKAAIPVDELNSFIGSASTLGVFQYPMLLLAIANGIPILSDTLFTHVSLCEDATFSDMADKIIQNGGSSSEGFRLRLFLDSNESHAWRDLDVKGLKKWVSRIAQFTFRHAIV